MQSLQAIHTRDWGASHSNSILIQALDCVENDKILLFPELDFCLLPHEHEFFCTTFSHPKFKNISFNPHRNKVRGAKCNASQRHALKGMIERYSEHAKTLVDQLFPSYRGHIQMGRTSFRPIEIKGRIPKSLRKDDTRLHVDAFPMSPTQGRRIFRVFTNINPYGQPRIWRIGEPFIEVAKRFLPELRHSWWGRSAILRGLGLTKSYTTEYDYMMLQIHNLMKADVKYQRQASQCEVHFMPGSSWIVQTDSVSHAAISGQFAFEQTFYLPVSAMANPSLSPLRTLERLTGSQLA